MYTTVLAFYFDHQNIINDFSDIGVNFCNVSGRSGKENTCLKPPSLVQENTEFDVFSYIISLIPLQR